MNTCKHFDLIVQRNNGVRWVTCTQCFTDFFADTRGEALRYALTCETCGGTGVTYKQAQYADGSWTREIEERPCPSCVDGIPRWAVDHMTKWTTEVFRTNGIEIQHKPWIGQFVRMFLVALRDREETE